MAVVTWLGVNPAVYLFASAVPLAFGSLHGVVELLVVNLFVVASLTWFFMPILTRLCHSWLRPAPHGE
jgi:antibiotic biosynthesis monooxygenase (ABM) superfamily enzyme